MTDQATFDFTAKTVTATGEVERLIGYLYNRGSNWTTAKEILADLGINDRKLRELKTLSSNRIISGPGCPGYKHISHCTLDEIKEVRNRFRSQIRAMLRQDIALGKHAHSRLNS